jgi:hypothetical protein
MIFRIISLLFSSEGQHAWSDVVAGTTGILFEFSGNYPVFHVSGIVLFGFVAPPGHGTLPATAA